jgi:hypothetical protein
MASKAIPSGWVFKPYTDHSVKTQWSKGELASWVLNVLRLLSEFNHQAFQLPASILRFMRDLPLLPVIMIAWPGSTQ